MTASASTGPIRRIRVPPIATAILFSVVIGGILVFVSGANPA